MVEELRRFPFLDNDHVIGGLLVELPNYLAAAEDVGEDVDLLQLIARSCQDGYQSSKS